MIKKPDFQIFYLEIRFFLNLSTKGLFKNLVKNQGLKQLLFCMIKPGVFRSIFSRKLEYQSVSSRKTQN